jgi:hypothetical protein
MPGGGLTQIIAIGSHNASFNLRNVAYEYHTFESNGLQPLIIRREADLATLEYLELSFNNPERNNLDDIKKLVLKMVIGGTLIQQFPLSLLINLNEPIICDGKMYINLCSNILFGDIKLIGLQHHDVIVEFINDNGVTCVSNYGIVSKLTYVDVEERRQIAQNSYEVFIQQISFINIMTDSNDTSQTSNIYELNYLPFSHISKGFFIECNNVDNLNNINLKFNQQERFNLNRFLIRTKCKKINENTLYFPFNYDKEYSDRTINSYEGSPNLSRVENINLKLTFDTPINNVKIYNLHANIYRQMSGMGGLAYTVELCRNTYDLRNNNLRMSDLRMSESVIGSSELIRFRMPNTSQLPSTLGMSIVYTGPTNRPIIVIDSSNCPILCEQIECGSRYMTCNECNNNFSEQAIKQWLESRSPSRRTCPLCRVHWSNFEIYINGEE